MKEQYLLFKSFLSLGFKKLYRRQAADSLTVDLTSPLELTLPNPIPEDTSNAALLLFRTGFPTTIEDWVEAQILANMFGTSKKNSHSSIHRCLYCSSEVMEQLRTVKQLGYTAGASIS